MIFKRPLSVPVVNALAVLLLGAALSIPAEAGMYRWKGSDGRVHYSDSLPPTQSSKGYQIIDPATGSVVQTIPPEKTQAQLDREKAAKQARQAKAKAKAERERQDSILLSLYSSVNDIKRVRDNQLEEIDRQIQQARTALGRAEKHAKQGADHDTNRQQAGQDARQLRANIADLQQKRRAVAKQFRDKIRRFEQIRH